MLLGALHHLTKLLLRDDAPIQQIVDALKHIH